MVLQSLRGLCKIAARGAIDPPTTLYAGPHKEREAQGRPWRVAP